MLRFCSIVFVCTSLLGLVACRLPPDRPPLKPLPESGERYSFDEILSRARTQATLALEAFYVDDWKELENNAQGLEQTARFLPQSTDPPARYQDTMVAQALELRKEALRLRTAAHAQDVEATTTALQRINLKIRQFRREPATVPATKVK